VIDLHTHSIFSDGVLIPAELVRRCEALGLDAVAITDHADGSNIDWIIPRIVAVAEELNRVSRVRIVPGIELTHLPPTLIAPMAQRARALGARIVIVHGETIAEPVVPGTNHAAILADIDILAHPGLITEEDVEEARKRGVFLEISARKGHSLTNGHVARLARKFGAELVLNSDAHEPGDLITEKWAEKVALGAGLSQEDFLQMMRNSESLIG